MTPEFIYWDSDAFLGWLKEEKGKAELCRGTIDRAESGGVVIFTSTLTIAEVLWMKGEPKTSPEKAAIVRKFFRRSYIKVRNVTRRVAESAQDLVWDHSIKPKDAIHVATAMDIGVPTLETFDEGLLKKSGSIGAYMLTIRKPLAPGQGTLDLK